MRVNDQVKRDTTIHVKAVKQKNKNESKTNDKKFSCALDEKSWQENYVWESVKMQQQNKKERKSDRNRICVSLSTFVRRERERERE